MCDFIRSLADINYGFTGYANPWEFWILILKSRHTSFLMANIHDGYCWRKQATNVYCMVRVWSGNLSPRRLTLYMSYAQVYMQYNFIKVIICRLDWIEDHYRGRPLAYQFTVLLFHASQFCHFYLVYEYSENIRFDWSELTSNNPISFTWIFACKQSSVLCQDSRHLRAAMVSNRPSYLNSGTHTGVL